MSYPNAPILLKGALIYFGAPMIVPVPNVIMFQYNPETLSRGFTPWAPPAKEVIQEIDEHGRTTNEADVKAYDESQKALALPYDPTETFSLVLELDATDALENPLLHPIALISGVADRLAAIEMLLYPPGDSLLGNLLGKVSVSLGSGGLEFGLNTEMEPDLERRDSPIVLFFWGPGRIVPVRIKSLTIEEQAFSPTLYPLRAQATIGIEVLTPQDLKKVTGKAASGFAAELATGCYVFTRGQKEMLATANLANGVESIIGMLPI